MPQSERDLQSHSDCQKRCPSDDHPMAFLYDPRDAGESSLPTHPYKKRLGHHQKKGLLAPYTPGVNTARLCRFPPKGRKNGIDD